MKTTKLNVSALALLFILLSMAGCKSDEKKADLVSPNILAPGANSAAYDLDEDSSVDFPLVGSVDATRTPSFRIVSGPSHGEISGEIPNLKFTPAANFNGPDSIGFIVNDGEKDSEVAQITFNVRAVNDPPRALGQNLSVNEDTTLAVQLRGEDVDGDSLTYIITRQPTHGSLSGQNGASINYRPSSNYSGSDSFGFKVSDGSVVSSEANVSLSIAAINDAPAARSQGVLVDYNLPRNIALSAIDAENESLTYEIVSPPIHGALSGTAPNVVYTPSTNYSGPDSFTFKAKDSNNVYSSAATIYLTVNNFVCADQWNNYKTVNKELHFVGINRPLPADQQQEVVVNNKKMNNILFLSSYKAATWKITIASGSGVEKVYVNGYETQTVVGIAANKVVIRSHTQTQTQFFNPSLYTNEQLYPIATVSADPAATPAADSLETLTGAKLRSIQGGYNGGAKFDVNQRYFKGHYGRASFEQESQVGSVKTAILKTTCLKFASTLQYSQAPETPSQFTVRPGNQENGVLIPELHFVGVHQGPAGDNSTIEVEVITGRPTVLVLSSAEKVDWKITPRNGSSILGLYILNAKGGLIK